MTILRPRKSAVKERNIMLNREHAGHIATPPVFAMIFALIVALILCVVGATKDTSDDRWLSPPSEYSETQDVLINR